MTDDLILKIRLETLQQNLKRAANVLDMVKEWRAGIQELETHIGNILSSIEAVESCTLDCQQSIDRSMEKEESGIRDHLNAISDKIKNLRDNWRTTRDCLQKMKKGFVKTEGPGPEARLTNAAVKEIEKATRKHQHTLKGIQDEMKTIGGNNQGDGASAEDLRKKAWGDYATETEHLNRVFAEYIDFLRGLALRDTGFDEGICELADELINKWVTGDLQSSLSIPARQEAMNKTLARIIRLGFPEWTIWALPLVACEFGHVVSDTQELRKTLENEGYRDKLPMRHLRHFVADAFATYIMGPAYACAAILLRFNPPTAYQDQDEHPAEAKRAYVIFTMLEQMNNENGMAGPYTGIIQTLKDGWKAAVRQANPPDILTTQDEVQWEKWVETLKNTFYFELGLLYSPSWRNVDRWREQLYSDQDFEVNGTEDLRDVLNAAWLCRIDHIDEDPSGTERIAARAKKLWKDITEKKPERSKATRHESGVPSKEKMQ